MSAHAVTPTEDDLARCAGGRHYPEHTASRGVVKCRNCNQIDVAPGCKFYVSPEQPECGKISVAYVTVTGSAVKARVPLCVGHKQEHDVTFARRRTKS
jgi:hypothetical protein